MPTATRKYDHIKQRLDDWGEWRRNEAMHIGWNVSIADPSPIRGIQKRNDTYANPVLIECQRMDHAQRRLLTTDSAVEELAHPLKTVVRLKHMLLPESSHDALARRLECHPRTLRRRLNDAYQALDAIVDGMRRQRGAARLCAVPARVAHERQGPRR